MNRLKTFLLCFCLILTAFPAAGSSDDNQNATPVDDSLTIEPATIEGVSGDPIVSEPEPSDIVEQEEEPDVIEEPAQVEEVEPIEETETIEEAPIEEPVMVPEPKTPEQIEPEPEAADVIEDDCSEGCPIEEPEEVEPEEPACSEGSGCSVDEPEEESPCTIEDEPGCSEEEETPVIEEEECSGPDEQEPEASEQSCPVKEDKCTTKPKPSESSCPEPDVKEDKCPAIVKPVDTDEGCPKVDDPIKPPVKPPVDEEEEEAPVTPEDPEEPEDQDKITTVKLCKNNVCTVGAAGKVLSITNYASAKDVSYAELLAFLKEDKTDELPYTSTFQCGDFAVLLHNNAEKAGIKAGFEGANGCKHAFCMFQTTDKGLVYIDCTGVPGGKTLQDKQLNVKIGQPLTGKYLFRNGGALDMGCTVTSLVTYW